MRQLHQEIFFPLGLLDKIRPCDIKNLYSDYYTFFKHNFLGKCKFKVLLKVYNQKSLILVV